MRTNQMTVYDSSKGKSLKCITRDKRVPLFHSHHNRAHTESSHQRNLPNVCLEHTWHLARGSLIKPSLNMNESHITVLQRHRLKMFSTLLSIIHPAQTHETREKGENDKFLKSSLTKTKALHPRINAAKLRIHLLLWLETVCFLWIRFS